MRRITGLFVVATAGLQAGVAIAEPLPVLQLTPPSNWSRADASADDPAVYLAPNSEAELDIYRFKRHGGDFQAQFRQTLLRELVANERREVEVAGTPHIEAVPVRGAEAAMFAIFLENRPGTSTSASPHCSGPSISSKRPPRRCCRP